MKSKILFSVFLSTFLYIPLEAKETLNFNGTYKFLGCDKVDEIFLPTSSAFSDDRKVSAHDTFEIHYHEMSSLLLRTFKEDNHGDHSETSCHTFKKSSSLFPEENVCQLKKNSLEIRTDNSESFFHFMTYNRTFASWKISFHGNNSYSLLVKGIKNTYPPFLERFQYRCHIEKIGH